jgi:UDP-N-acetylmuramyl-tripeptide synthetase
MRLGELVQGWLQVPARYHDLAIEEITCDSRRVGRGALFVALAGEKTDGLLYAADSVRRGAVAILCAKDSASAVSSRQIGVPVFKVADVRDALGRLANAFYRTPSRELAVCGVTGTKGKTTTTWLLDHILAAAGKTTGLFGTVENRIAARRFEASNTTAGCLELHAWLRELAESGGTHATLEVSSHALDQRRTAGIEFDCAVFTNIAPEHLDYHGTMDAYLAAKARLFVGLRPQAVAVLPRHDRASQVLAAATRANIRWYGTDSQDGVTGLRMSPDGSEFRWHGHPVRTTLWGLYNLENALAAMAAADCLGIDAETIVSAMRDPRLPPGRLEQVRYPVPFRVVVDYAHTDGSLAAVLDALRPLTPGRLITIFGCGGDRDTSKRPRMGRVAEERSDRIIVTSDNPRSEPPQRILAEIVAGLEHPNDAAVVDDRREAIALGIRMAREGDTVLIAGKGHETYQELSHGKVHFDDREVALEFLRESLEGCRS